MADNPSTEDLQKELAACHNELGLARGILQNVWETTHGGDLNYWPVIESQIENFLSEPSLVKDDEHVSSLKNIIRSYTDILKIMDSWCRVIGYPPKEMSSGLNISEILGRADDVILKFGPP